MGKSKPSHTLGLSAAKTNRLPFPPATPLGAAKRRSKSFFAHDVHAIRHPIQCLVFGVGSIAHNL